MGQEKTCMKYRIDLEDEWFDIECDYIYHSTGVLVLLREDKTIAMFTKWNYVIQLKEETKPCNG